MTAASYVPTSDRRSGANRLPHDAVEHLRALLVAIRDDEIARLAQLTSTDVRTANDEHSEISAELSNTALVEIESALSRLATGTYGSCESCGDVIPFERLEAIPYATRCVSCVVARSQVFL
jgi:RNA polymerase-binding transcription factor DksA